MNPTTNVDGFMSDVDLAPYDEGEADRIRNVLNAGATLNLVERNPQDPDHYRLRSEFFEYLNLVCERELQTDSDLSASLRHDGRVSETERERELVSEEKLRRLVPHLEDATHPNSRASADAVLRLMQPYSADPQYSNRIELEPAIKRYEKIALDTFKAEARQNGYYDNNQDSDDVEKHIAAQCGRLLTMYEDTVRHVLNVGASEHEVVEDPNETDVFYVKPTFHRALVKLRKQGAINDQPSLDDLIMQRADEAVRKLKRPDPDQMQIEHDRLRLIASSDTPRANGVAPGDREWALHQFFDEVGLKRTEYDDYRRLIESRRERFEGAKRGLFALDQGQSAFCSRLVTIVRGPQDLVHRVLDDRLGRHSESFAQILRDVAKDVEEVLVVKATQDVVEEMKKEISSLNWQLSPDNPDDGTDVLRRLGSADEAQLNDDLLKIEAFEENNFHIGEDFPAVVDAIENLQLLLQTQEESRGARA